MPLCLNDEMKSKYGDTRVYASSGMTEGNAVRYNIGSDSDLARRIHNASPGIGVSMVVQRSQYIQSVKLGRLCCSLSEFLLLTLRVEFDHLFDEARAPECRRVLVDVLRC
jgi:hypothetical protein